MYICISKGERCHHCFYCQQETDGAVVDGIRATETETQTGRGDNQTSARKPSPNEARTRAAAALSFGPQDVPRGRCSRIRHATDRNNLQASRAAEASSRDRRLPSRVFYKPGSSYLRGVATYTCQRYELATLCLEQEGWANQDSPLTICLCLFNQLLGWSFLCRTTWLLWSRLVRSYHAVEIMAFSRWRFLIICS